MPGMPGRIQSRGAAITRIVGRGFFKIKVGRYCYMMSYK